MPPPPPPPPPPVPPYNVFNWLSGKFLFALAPTKAKTPQDCYNKCVADPNCATFDYNGNVNECRLVHTSSTGTYGYGGASNTKIYKQTIRGPAGTFTKMQK